VVAERLGLIVNQGISMLLGCGIKVEDVDEYSPTDILRFYFHRHDAWSSNHAASMLSTAVDRLSFNHERKCVHVHNIANSFQPPNSFQKREIHPLSVFHPSIRSIFVQIVNSSYALDHIGTVVTVGGCPFTPGCMMVDDPGIVCIAGWYGMG
jgi:hypothetical protein